MPINSLTHRTRPEIVAELSANHNGSLSQALALVRAAAEAGVDAIKLQTYTPDTITLNASSPDFIIAEDHPLWAGRQLYDLYREAHTPWDWHEPIISLARDLGLDAFSTPFDESAVDFLEQLGVTRYKIASLEIVDIPLITKVAATGKPIVLSTGASKLTEVDEAHAAIMRENPEALVTLLLCSSSYPARPETIGLANMEMLRQRYRARVGFSDHTEGLGAAIAAAALGAEMIEKHIKSDDAQSGVDNSFSSSEAEMRLLVRYAGEAALAAKDVKFGPNEDEKESRRLRPSLWVTKSVAKGDVVSEKNVKSLRPGGGISPSQYSRVLGLAFSRDVSPATALTFDLLTEQ